MTNYVFIKPPGTSQSFRTCIPTRVMSSDYEYSDDERNFYDEDEDMIGSEDGEGNALSYHTTRFNRFHRFRIRREYERRDIQG